MTEKKIDDLKIKIGERYVVTSYIGQTLILSNVFPTTEEQKIFLEKNKKCVKEMKSSEDTEFLIGEDVKEFDKLFSIGLFDDYKEKPLKGGFHRSNCFIHRQRQNLYSSYNVEGQIVVQHPNAGIYCFAGLLTENVRQNIPLHVYRYWSYVITGHSTDGRVPCTHIHLDFHPHYRINPGNLCLYRNPIKDLKVTFELASYNVFHHVHNNCNLYDILNNFSHNLRRVHHDTGEPYVHRQDTIYIHCLIKINILYH